MRGPLLPILSVAFVSWSGGVLAAESNLDYTPAPGCPSREEVSARLAARAPRARDIAMTVEASGAGFVGHPPMSS